MKEETKLMCPNCKSLFRDVTQMKIIRVTDKPKPKSDSNEPDPNADFS